MPRTILYEGDNLKAGDGTGITTYARTLTDIARELGYATDVLVSATGLLYRKGEILNEIALYDAVNTQGPRWRQRLTIKLREAVGAPFGIRPVTFRAGTVVAGGGEQFLSRFSTVHAATDILDVARLHFCRWNRRLDLKLSGTPDLFHATQATPIAVRGAANIYTIHDIVPLRAPETTMDIKRYVFDMVQHLCRHADHIVTVSEFSRADIMKLAGISADRITNTYQAADLPVAQLARSDNDISVDLARIYGLDFKEYFLFVGALEPKKNVPRLIEAYATSGTKRPLIIAGRLGWQYEEILEKIADERFMRIIQDGNEFAIRRRVRHLDYVPAHHLVTLLRGARAVLFPSIYEGFGLPVLEAMLAGAPVLTSRASSLAEIAGEAALLVDPFDVGEMALAISHMDNDADLRNELSRRGLERAKEFSRERYQRRIDALYRKILS